MSGTGLIQVKIQEKVDAIPGERVCAVGLLKNLTLGATIDYAAKSKPTRFFVNRGQGWNVCQSNIKQRFCSSTCFIFGHKYG